MGCDEPTPYRLADFTKKLSWGKMRTLQRCHLMTSEALQLLLQGNVEESLWEAMPDCGCGFDEGSDCEKLSAEWFAFADAAVDADLRRWMGALPLQLTFTMAGRRLRVIHGAVNEINEDPTQ